jgi:murein DD-endopeptidase MepM/ murein hydrolase activator NlpD
MRRNWLGTQHLRITPSRHLLIVAAAAALSLVGGSLPGATAQTTPSAGLPGASGNNNATTTTAPKPTSTVPPTTAVPAASVPPTAGETKIVLVPPAAPGAPTAIIMPAEPLTPPPGPPPPSLSPGQVAEVLRSQQRSGASSTSALVEALRPLENLGMTAEEALSLGMGQFPMLGVANWTDDWLDPRAGPPPHQHQGTDVFAAFDTPVRAPVDGIVRFEDAGLGGKGAFVTAPDRTYYYMAHLKGFNPDLRNGAAVKQGQVIGYNGDSGNAQGGAPHVHFEVHPGGGPAVNPKPLLDAWAGDALAKARALVASFEPKTGDGEAGSVDDGIPQILVATGLTRRFSVPSPSVPNSERPTTEDFNRAVLGPLTPTALAVLLDP